VEGISQYGGPVFVAFTGPDDDLMLLEIDIFDP
jgi:hypothetical protein